MPKNEDRDLDLFIETDLPMTPNIIGLVRASFEILRQLESLEFLDVTVRQNL